MSTQPVKITVAGMDFSIHTDETPTYVTQIANVLDGQIDKFLENNENAQLTTACILISIENLDLCIKAEGEKEQLRVQVVQYLEEATKATAEISQLKKEIDNMQKEKEALKEEIQVLQLKLTASDIKGKK